MRELQSFGRCGAAPKLSEKRTKSGFEVGRNDEAAVQVLLQTAPVLVGAIVEKASYGVVIVLDGGGSSWR